MSDPAQGTEHRADQSHPEYLDYFSDQSESYATYRPGYPDDLFAFLGSLVDRHALAWDAGTGNGQAALGLAPYFDRVIATDASAMQLAAAPHHEKVTYRQAVAGRTELEDGAIDLATVAQALHWFDREAYFAESQRVVRPGGVIAVWCYTWTQTTPDLNSVLSAFVSETLGAWWTPERQLVDTGYRDVQLPFPEIETPVFAMQESWNLGQVLGYVGTWSAVRRCRAATGADPIPALGDHLREVWRDPDSLRLMTWPIFLRACRVPPAEH
ncbi:MAG: class I SAM-dependent methyltransferase [Gemmatimonadales bacterium]|nr:MAG: class I SAM-dependent methyltransferase [Gemmatimonadales bacterium]